MLRTRTRAASQPPSIPFPTAAKPWLKFVALYALLQAGWHAVGATGLGDEAIVRLAVQPAVLLLDILDPGMAVSAQGRWIVALGSRLNVRPGCDGADLAILLIAAFAAAGLPWRAALRGLLGGMFIAFALNQARIVTLFLALRADPSRFALLHEFVLPTVLSLALLAYFHRFLTASRAASIVVPAIVAVAHGTG